MTQQKKGRKGTSGKKPENLFPLEFSLLYFHDSYSLRKGQRKQSKLESHRQILALWDWKEHKHSGTSDKTTSTTVLPSGLGDASSLRGRGRGLGGMATLQ